ncbi:(+)-alpha-terpineol synthase-like isoform X1 [Daucus carota subsp. sativus]|uniref:(+)-alpha-terpineol synthase-like isoform X1 n=1 Tax=Daucus carota subsp. sativus TaxID=79200 RepID=UPI0030830259
MALQCLSSTLLVTALPRSSVPLERHHNKSFATQRSVQCIKTRATIINQDSGAALRRNANYPPSSWDYNFVKSLTSDYTVLMLLLLLLLEERYARQLDELKDDVKRLIHAETDDPLAKLKLLDTVQRLGLNYRFQNDVKQAVAVIYNDISDESLSDDLYTTALQFRMLRELAWIYRVTRRVRSGGSKMNPIL